MSCRIQLPFWPASSNCLDWSKDNWLVVGGGESVAVLVPRLHGPDHTGSYWNVAAFKVNAFKAADVPLLDPFDSDAFSIGEEQSQRLVDSLSWSPPGLAEFGRSALAVLSSNHVLSLYESDGRPEDAASWKRRIIVNHAIKDYYQQNEEANEEHEGSGPESLQVRQRIRSFAWSPRLFDRRGNNGGASDPYLAQGRQYLAVSTGAGDILFFVIESPRGQIPIEGSAWKATVVASMNVSDDIDLICTQLQIELAEEIQMYMISRSLTANALTWNFNTIRDDKGDHAQLAFTVKGRLFTTTLHTNDNDALLSMDDNPRHLLPQIADFGKTMCFVPKSGELIAFTAESALVLSNTVHLDSSNTAPRDADVISSLSLNGRWDSITGIALTTKPGGETQLHFTSLISTTSCDTCSLPVQPSGVAQATRRSWQYAIDEAKALFSAEHDLGGHVQERAWGIAASPLGDYVATCTSMHPSDTVAYEPALQQTCVVNISLEADVPKHRSMPDAGGTSSPCDVPVDTVLFSLQRHIQRKRDSEGASTNHQALVRLLEADLRRTATEQQPWEGNGVLTSMGSEAEDDLDRVRMLKRGLLWDPEIAHHQRARIVQIALSEDVENADAPGERDIVARLVKIILANPPKAQQDEKETLSRQMFRAAHVIHAKVHSKRLEHGDSGSSGEICNLCDSPIAFENVQWARCSSGHRFARCGLTFVGIQEPGRSKYCCVCNKQYLNGISSLRRSLSPETDGPLLAQPSDTSHANGDQIEVQEASTDQRLAAAYALISLKQSHTTKTPFIALLFAAIDRCLYCGGKFVA